MGANGRPRLHCPTLLSRAPLSDLSWAGSTENSTVTTALLTNLVERGLRVAGPMLFVIDGSKALRKSLRDVFGDRAKVHCCQVHKTRNVTEHLPESRRGYVARQMRDAYASGTSKTAKKKLLQLVSCLESNGEDSTAARLREGLDETLTVVGLGLPPTLRRSFATTNAIEKMNGALRRVARNVKCWSLLGQLVAKSHPKNRVVARELAYFRKNKKRMRCAEWQRQGFVIGSGVVESACKTLVASV